MPLMEVTDANFKEQVLEAKGVFLLDFGATWCGPCKQLDPIVKDLAEEYDGKAQIAKVDIGEHREVATHFGVMNVPMVIILKDGEVAKTYSGVAPKKEYAKALDEALG